MDVLLTGITVKDIGAASLVVLAIISILRGWLVPRRTLDTLTEIWHQRLDDKDTTIEYLQRANAALEARGNVLAAQVDSLIEQGRTTERLLQGLSAVALEGGKTDGPT